MASDVASRENRYIAPGTKVRLDSYWNGGDELSSEFGVVIHCWHDERMGGFDCYIAFFGDAFPTGEVAEQPYVLRYSSTALVELQG